MSLEIQERVQGMASSSAMEKTATVMIGTTERQVPSDLKEMMESG